LHQTKKINREVIMSYLLRIVTVFLLSISIVAAKPVAWTGSAFFINNSGYLATAAHCVQDEKTLQNVPLFLVFYKGAPYVAKIVAKDVVNDVAIVHINKTDTPYLSFNKSSYDNET